MGAPSPSMPQNPTNQPMQQHQYGGKGGGKGMSTPSVSQSSPDQLEQMIPYNRTTMSATSGQAQVGQPNAYANTTGSWDNQSNQQPQTQMSQGKSKGQ